MLTTLALGGFLFAQEPPEVLSTAKDRVDLGITIYHGDLAMVRDTRRVELPAGRSRLAFADVAASIRPKSAWVQFKGATPTVLERNFEFDLLSPQSLVDRSLGSTAGIRKEGGTFEWGELVSLPLRSPRSLPIQLRLIRASRVIQAADLSVLIRTPIGALAQPEDALGFMEMPSQLRPSPTLLMDLEAPVDCSIELELAYTAEQVGWEATYIARLDAKGRRLDLDGFVTLRNHSGTSFPATTLQLVAGDPNKAPEPRPDKSHLPQGAVVECVAATVQPKFKEEVLSDYQLLSLNRPTSLGEGQSKQVRLFSVTSIEVDRTFYLEFSPQLEWFSDRASQKDSPGPWIEEREWKYSWILREAGINPDLASQWMFEWAEAQEQPEIPPAMKPLWVSPTLLLHLKNQAKRGLGRPLPQGQIYFRIKDGRGFEFPLATQQMDATPTGEEAIFQIDSDLYCKGVQAHQRWRPLLWKDHWMELEGESEIRNDRNEVADVLLRTNLPQDSEIRFSSVPSRSIEPGTFDFRLTVPPHSTRNLRFTARIPKSGLPFSY